MVECSDIGGLEIFDESHNIVEIQEKFLHAYIPSVTVPFEEGVSPLHTKHRLSG